MKLDLCLVHRIFIGVRLVFSYFLAKFCRSYPVKSVWRGISFIIGLHVGKIGQIVGLVLVIWKLFRNFVTWLGYQAT